MMCHRIPGRHFAGSEDHDVARIFGQRWIAHLRDQCFAQSVAFGCHGVLFRKATVSEAISSDKKAATRETAVRGGGGPRWGWGGAGSGYSSNKCPSPHCSSHVRYTPKSGQTQRRSVVRKVPFAAKRLGLRLRGSVAKVQLGKRRNGSSSAPLSAAGGVFVLIF